MRHFLAVGTLLASLATNAQTPQQTQSNYPQFDFDQAVSTVEGELKIDSQPLLVASGMCNIPFNKTIRLGHNLFEDVKTNKSIRLMVMHRVIRSHTQGVIELPSNFDRVSLIKAKLYGAKKSKWVVWKNLAVSYKYLRRVLMLYIELFRNVRPRDSEEIQDQLDHAIQLARLQFEFGMKKSLINQIANIGLNEFITSLQWATGVKKRNLIRTRDLELVEVGPDQVKTLYFSVMQEGTTELRYGRFSVLWSDLLKWSRIYTDTRQYQIEQRPSQSQLRFASDDLGQVKDAVETARNFQELVTAAGFGQIASYMIRNGIAFDQNQLVETVRYYCSEPSDFEIIRDGIISDLEYQLTFQP